MTECTERQPAEPHDGIAGGGQAGMTKEGSVMTSLPEEFAKDTRPQVLAKLVTDGVLTVEKDRVLWVFPRTKYPPADGGEPVAGTEARQRMRAAVLGSGAADPRTAALCALVAATDLDRKVFADLDRKRVKARLMEIGEGAWAAAAVRKTIEEIQATVMIAIVASTTAATAGMSA
jgi:hypothetical protein